MIGIELQKNSKNKLNKIGIPCYSSTKEQKSKYDTVFMFHVLEHLYNPLETLKDIKNNLLEHNGYIVIEVPHARDFLLNNLRVLNLKILLFGHNI